MVSHTYPAKFTWPDTGPQAVVVTGSFDNWSGNTHYLNKTEGGFEGIIELDFEKAYEFKYVVDGTWQAREDQDKEWDFQGNMNNVYRTPAAPAQTQIQPEQAPVSVESNREQVIGHGLHPDHRATSITSATSVKDAELTNASPLSGHNNVVQDATSTNGFDSSAQTASQQIAADNTTDSSTSFLSSSPSASDHSKQTVVVPTPAQHFAYSTSRTTYDPSQAGVESTSDSTPFVNTEVATPKTTHRELSNDSYPSGLGAVMGGIEAVREKVEELVIGKGAGAEEHAQAQTKALESVDKPKFVGNSGISEADTDFSMLDDNFSSTASEHTYEHITPPRIEEETLVVVPHPVSTSFATTADTSPDVSSTSPADAAAPPHDEEDLPAHAQAAAHAINSANASHPAASDPNEVHISLPERDTQGVFVPPGSGDPSAMEPTNTILERQGEKQAEEEKKQDVGTNSSNAAWSKAPTTESATTPLNNSSSDDKKSTPSTDAPAYAGPTSTPIHAPTPKPAALSSSPSFNNQTPFPTSASATLSTPQTQNIHATPEPVDTSDFSLSSSHLKSPTAGTNFSRSSASSPARGVPGYYPPQEGESATSTPTGSPVKASVEDGEAARKRKSSLFGKIGKLFGGGK